MRNEPRKTTTKCLLLYHMLCSSPENAKADFSLTYFGVFFLTTFFHVVWVKPCETCTVLFSVFFYLQFQHIPSFYKMCIFKTYKYFRMRHNHRNAFTLFRLIYIGNTKIAKMDTRNEKINIQ